MSTLTLELVCQTEELIALEPEWRALWQRDPDASPFQSPEWLMPWWQVFGTGRPIVSCIYLDNRLAGLLPLYLLETGEPAPNTCKLLPFGVGLSDYSDALLDPALPKAAVDDLLEAALRAGRNRGATVCDLTDVPCGARLRDAQAPAAWQAHWHRDLPCPVLQIPDKASGVQDAVPPRMGRKLRMNRNRAERLGRMAIDFIPRSNATAALHDLLELNGRHWGQADAAVKQFHCLAVPRLLDAGQARLGRLRIDGAVAAVCYALADQHDRLMLYMSGFDAAFAAVSPGSLLVAGMIEAAIGEGRREIHFLRGGETYKYSWGARDRYNAACRLLPQ